MTLCIQIKYSATHRNAMALLKPARNQAQKNMHTNSHEHNPWLKNKHP